MRSYQDTFSIAGSKQYRGGRFFLLESVTNEVDIEFFSPQGSPIGKVLGMTSGFNIDMLDVETGQFGFCEVTSSVAQTIKVVIGNQKASVFKTSSEISGGQLTPRTLVTHYGGVVTNTVVTVITPAANVNGVRIDGINVIKYDIHSQFSVLSKTSAPTTWDDVSARKLFNALFTTSSNIGSVDKLDFPFIIPAGEGLYTMASAAVAGSVSINYEVL